MIKVPGLLEGLPEAAGVEGEVRGDVPAAPYEELFEAAVLREAFHGVAEGRASVEGPEPRELRYDALLLQDAVPVLPEELLQ